MSYGSNVSGFDVREFTGPARVASRSAQHVARGLEAAIPIDATPEERAALERAIAAGDAVQASLLDREQATPARVRPAYVAFVTLWSIFNDALVAIARIPGEISPRGPRAAALMSEVLPEGIAFAQLEAGQAWAAAARRLALVDDKGLGPVIAEAIGADVLEGVRGATLRLREAVGAGPTPTEFASSTAVAEKLADFSRLVGIYCRLLSAKVDEADLATVERFRKAVGPLIEYRASRRGQDETGDDALPVGDPAIPPGMPGASPFVTGPTA